MNSRNPFVVMIWSLLGILVSSSVGAQSLMEADQIFANKRHYSLTVTPLDSYFINNPGQAPNSPPPRGLNERLYRASWQIDEHGLWLIKLEAQKNSHPIELTRKLPIFAQWYTGVLVAPSGKELFFDLSGEATAFTHYQLWSVKNGAIVDQVQMNYSLYQQYKRRQFEQFKATKDYQDIITSLQETGISTNLDSYVFEEGLGFLETPAPFKS